MSILLKYIQEKSLQILIPNQLGVDAYFAFILRNLLIINIFTSNIVGFKNAIFSFFFSLNNLFNRSRIV